MKLRRETGHCEADRVERRPVSTLETFRPASLRFGSPFRATERPLTGGGEVCRTGGLEIWSKRGLSLLLRNSLEKSKVDVLENALTLLDLRVGGARSLLAAVVAVTVVGVEVEEDDDWFPLREEDLKAATAITRKM